MDTPTILTENLKLRKIELNDYIDLYDLCSDNEVTKYLSFNTHKNILETKKFVKKYINKEKNDNHFFWVIVKDNKAIGTIEAYINEENLSEIAFALSKNYWNKGYMTEVLKNIINFLFSLGVKKIRAMHIKENIVSGVVMSKIGMIKNDFSKPTFKKNNITYNLIEYYILNNQ
ncbi:MAG: GNAT family N-acetyltransferase [Oceanivirga sp.]|nr:GNAT family N-acetyltransferase [Oceanivirga sp.]